MALSLAGAEAHQLALQVAAHAGQPAPALADTDAMLDNIEDCITVHACHGLPDTPVRGSSLNDCASACADGNVSDGALDYS